MIQDLEIIHALLSGRSCSSASSDIFIWFHQHTFYKRSPGRADEDITVSLFRDPLYVIRVIVNDGAEVLVKGERFGLARLSSTLAKLFSSFAVGQIERSIVDLNLDNFSALGMGPQPRQGQRWIYTGCKNKMKVDGSMLKQE